MKAIIKTGGQQYLVTEGQTLEVDVLPAGTKKLQLDALLTIDGDKIQVGRPNVKGVTVTAEVVGEAKGDKIQVLKFKPKKREKTLTGHRQHYSVVKITGIGAAKDDKKEAKTEAPKADDGERKTSDARKPATKKEPAKSAK